jgi:hypothetical protein
VVAISKLRRRSLAIARLPYLNRGVANLKRPLQMIDDQEFFEAFGRLVLQAELFLYGSKDRRAGGSGARLVPATVGSA